MFNSIDVAKNTNNIVNIIHSKLNNINKFITLSKELLNDTKSILNKHDIKISNILENELFTHEPHLFSNKGKLLINYKLFNTQVKDTKNLEYLYIIGELDMYTSIISLMDSYKNTNTNICFSNYSENKQPLINTSHIWHPYLSDNIVTNNINIGDKTPRNILITGPNAGGKSTFIKSLAISILFSQTLGIAFAKSFCLTPFTLINTYLNIPDCKGKESLFEAEMNRSKNHLEILDNLKKDELSFIIMDEVFRVSLCPHIVERYFDSY